MKTQLSKLIIFSVVLFFTFTLTVSFIKTANAQSTTANPTPSSQSGGSGGSNYKPITPGYENFFTDGINFGQMVTQIFRLSIVLTVVLAVVMMIIGGIQYMGSESIFRKDEGKQRIFAAISGLLIALISILVISTILPGSRDGTQFEINIFGNLNE